MEYNCLYGVGASLPCFSEVYSIKNHKSAIINLSDAPDR